ncbi:uncharacterized protein BXZ73DRAFT_86656 [Epithele typhae]|uniref:uncharacterized protein n=1 Tax=Epithele typhae TaxID=378194 RepID=UPI002008B854|nr:uncharacterized protein BXZ73DRAFT_86656 [Epithele typhae]KAH9945090.1 hypothetical protein BXZ73DRAFT_86656 [Epithele typhae]
MTSHGDPNFPSDLDIHPLLDASASSDSRFDSCAQREAIESYGIAGRIWEASHAMLAYLDSSSQPQLEFDPPAFTHECPRTPVLAIELGSGNGFLATHLSKWLQPDYDLLVATDLPEVCPLLDANLSGSAAVLVRPLAWGSSDQATSVLSDLSTFASSEDGREVLPRQPTHILCSDLIYFPALLAPLLRSLLHLTSIPTPAPDLTDSRSPPLVIISYKIRSLAKETPFWHAFGLFFEFSPVLSRTRRNDQGSSSQEQVEESWVKFSPGDDLDETFVFIAKRKRESLLWKIPEEDSALLAGVGADGTSSPKSDDQFEQLLLMGMDV